MAKRKAIAVVYSDHHLNIWNKYGERRLEDGLVIMRIIKLKAKTLRVPTLFLGDLIHKEKQISNKLLSVLLPFFKRVWGSYTQPTYGISGNHDQCEENTLKHKSPSYINTFAQIFDGLICVDNHSEVVPPNMGNMIIHGIPYLTHDLGLEEAIKERVKAISKYKTNILLLHTTLKGAKDTDGRVMESHVGKRVTRLLKKFDIVFVGHIHKPMKLGKNIYQVGAPNHQRKTDREVNLGYCILYSDLSVEYIHLDKYPKFVELENGETIPDNKNFYYHKEKPVESKNGNTTQDFSDTTNHTKLAKGYLKEKGIKDKKKRKALINILKNND